MSILGLYNWDPTILNALDLPAEIDKKILIPDLLAQLAEYEIIYPDADTVRAILESWSRHRKPVWERIVKATAAEYDPIENYDRREDWTDDGTGSASGSADQYSAGYNPNNQGDPPGMVKQASTDTGSSSSSNVHHVGRIHGNIGVTTSQQMLEQELAVAGKLDPYQYIINDFKRRFCVLLF